MRLLEIIADKILDLPLFEMAMERKQALQTIRGISSSLSIHLVKYFAFDDVARNHWMTEINGYLLSINRCTLKPNKKKFSGDVYYSLMFDEQMDDSAEGVTELLTQLTRTDYKNCVRSGLSDREIYEKIEQVLHTISYDIANKKFTSFDDYV